MLKRKYRLNAKSRVERGIFFTTPFFTLRIAKNNLLYNRYRFTVPKKVDKRAVVRNRIRRKLSGCIENLWGEIKIGFDFIFFVKREISSEEEKNLCVVVKEIFIKNELLK